jgi:hydrogenase maturation protease
VRVVVLGLGNPLLADDGVGLVMLARLSESGHWPDEVELVDGGTWGLSLLPDIRDASALLVLDAVRADSSPGTVLRGEGDAVPRLYRRPPSPHRIDLGEVLAAAELLGGVPERLAVVGVEPEETDDLRIGLSPSVDAAVDRAVAEAERVLAGWGMSPTL